MCGIAGFFSLRPDARHDETVVKMASALAHRGPDSAGAWTDRDAGIFFSHRRLSILDLTESGSQPMVSHDGNWVIVLNGEIYNYPEMRAALEAEGVTFRGRSDTEVFLESMARHGIEATLQSANGMFAFALWNRDRRELTLARDRFGEKPLYYGWSGGNFFFASELKAFRAHPDFREEFDHDAAALFLRLSYIPAPLSIAKGISKLTPGAYLTLPTRNGKQDPQVKPYWSALTAAASARSLEATQSPSERLDELDFRLKDSVRRRLQSDVPVGAFLSGGIDSSLIVALTQEVASQPVQTFTIGFTEKTYDEAPFAAAIAKHLGTRHSELYVTPEQAREVIPRLPHFYDEPFADASQIPTFLVAALARQHVTVSLSGDAGDELFGGYNRHVWAGKLERALRHIPTPIAQAASRAILGIPPKDWELWLNRLGKVFGGPFRVSQPGQKAHKLAEAIRNPDPQSIYLQLVSQWRPRDGMVAAPELAGLTQDWSEAPGFSLAERLMGLDTVSYLADDILAKVDRATMGVSLEGRVPFLDPDVFETAWKFPLGKKISGGQGKQPLRTLLARRVPRALFERPKMGFSIPIDDWLRGPLRDWAEDLLSNRSLDEGLISAAAVRRVWSEHQAERTNHVGRIWNLLMLQAWRGQNRI